MAGWNNHRTEYISRTQQGVPGGFYTTCTWDRILGKPIMPSMIVLNSFNEFAEETGLQPTDTTAAQISIEAAQPKLDLGILSDLAGKTIVLGVIDLGDQTVESPEQIAQRIRRALPHVPAERLIPAPDCGMKYLAREIAFGKLAALSAGAAIVRLELN